jgi:hypothetical protein
MRTAGLADLLFAPDDPEALAGAVRRAADWRTPAPEVMVPGMEGLVAHMERIYAEAGELQTALAASR